MRNQQSWFLNFFVSKQDQIEIERPWRHRPRTCSAGGRFNRKEPVEQLPCRQFGLPHHDTVQVARLRGGHAHRLGVVPARLPKIGDEAWQGREPEGEIGFAIAEVAAEGDGDVRGRQGRLV